MESFLRMGLVGNKDGKDTINLTVDVERLKTSSETNPKNMIQSLWQPSYAQLAAVCC